MRIYIYTKPAFASNHDWSFVLCTPVVIDINKTGLVCITMKKNLLNFFCPAFGDKYNCHSVQYSVCSVAHWTDSVSGLVFG